MESLVFNGSATFNRQCVNITILDDDVRESSIIRSQPEVFRVLLRESEPSDAVQLSIQTSLVSIEDDDCKLNISVCVCVCEISFSLERCILRHVDVCRLKIRINFVRGTQADVLHHSFMHLSMTCAIDNALSLVL